MMRRLPIPVTPASHETVTSYIARLAALHGMPFGELWPHVSRPRRDGTTTRVVDAELLAAATGRPVEHLRRALLELRQPQPDWWSLRQEPQHGCPRCDARHPGGTVLHVFPHHRYACVRHRVWIGPPDLIGLPLPSLDALPEVVAAQRAHLRLLHRLGPAATFDAVLTAFLICGHLWCRLPEEGDDTSAWHDWQRRLDLLVPRENEDAAFSASRLFAATYPEAVKLAALIGSLHWRRLAAGDPGQQRQFTAEVAHRLNDPDYRPRIINDPLAHWMDTDCGHPPSLPAKRYDTRLDFRGGTPRKIPSSSYQRHKKSALWFSRGRPSGKVGSVMVSHRHLQPVLIRDWAPNYEFYVGHLSESTSTKLFHTKEAANPSPEETLHERMNAEYVRPEPLISDYLAAAATPVSWHATEQRLLGTARPLDQRPRR